MRHFHYICCLVIAMLFFSCAKEVDEINVIHTPMGGKVTFDIRSRYINGSTDHVNRVIESKSFETKKLGVIEHSSDSYGPKYYHILLEQYLGDEISVQVFMNIAHRAGNIFADIKDAHIYLRPGNKGENKMYKMHTSGYRIWDFKVNEDTGKMSGTFSYFAAKERPQHKDDHYLVQGTFEGYLLPEGDK
jgi:hypothetical protein